MVNTELLNKRIEASGLKRNFISSELNISRQTLYSKINNHTEFLSSEVQRLCELLGIKYLTEKEAIFFAKSVD